MTFQRWARSLIGAITADDSTASPVKAAGKGEADVQELFSREREQEWWPPYCQVKHNQADLSDCKQSAELHTLVPPGEGAGGEMAISSATCDLSNRCAKLCD